MLEIQNSDLKNFPIRLKKYISMLYVNQETDKYYRNMLPVEAYVILNYKDGKKKVLKEFSELETSMLREYAEKEGERRGFLRREKRGKK